MKDLLISKINQSKWWHVPPRDSHSYEKRGKFLASTYLQAEFYGKPSIEPMKVRINNPVFGFSEREIIQKLFGSSWQKYLNGLLKLDADFYEKRIELDRKMYIEAKSLGFDAIVLLTKASKKALQKGRKPNSIELNLLT